MAPNGLIKLRRFVRSWTISHERDVSDTFEHYRRMFRARFRREMDWLRLMVLGGILTTFSALALADALAVQPGQEHFSGGSAIFSGIIMILVVLKIARGDIYIDWLMNGIPCILAGVALSSDENLTSISTLIFLSTFLVASGIARIWIGLTASPEDGATWILSSGCVAILSAFWIFCAWFLAMPTTAALILAFDTLFQGIAMTGYGLSLKEER